MSKIMYAYLICHDRRDLKTHTYVGLTADYMKRLNQHNCKVAGGPRSTRRAAGSWETIMVLKIPTDRKYSSKIIKANWKQSSRGLESRIKKGFELALKYKLSVYIKKNQKMKIPILCDFKWSGNKVNLSSDDWSDLSNP
jgi:predicted GIY-YIG superfamily endonuclease